ncbi:hypothetical protein GCM10027258_72020 [Amycolatopsis stemonae]
MGGVLHDLRRARPLIVFGEHEQLRGWEWSGLVGKGDMLAVVELQAQLGSPARLLAAGALTLPEVRSDLILIGGPDGNPVTAGVLSRLDGVISIGFAADPGNGCAVFDRKSGLVASPRYDESGEPRTDYGLVIRTANPFAPETAEVVLVAGCWGYGTAAAAETLRETGPFGRHQHFEALVETTVVEGAHRDTSVRIAREIA